MKLKRRTIIAILVIEMTIMSALGVLAGCTGPTPTAEPPTLTITTAPQTITPTVTMTPTNTSPLVTPTSGISPLPTPTPVVTITESMNRAESAETEKPKMEETEMNLGIDFGSAAISGVSLVALVLLVVEGAKQFGVTGKASMGLSMGLGAVLLGLYAAIERGLVPVVALPWIEVVVYALGGAMVIGLGASGLYDILGRSGILKPKA